MMGAAKVEPDPLMTVAAGRQCSERMEQAKTGRIRFMIGCGFIVVRWVGFVINDSNLEGSRGGTNPEL
jgi:hypothetical protein